MAAGESADITTATESKGEGRFIGELRSVSVRTQRPNQHDSARAEKFHPNFSKPRALVGALKQVADLTEPTDRSRVHGPRKCAMKIIETLHKDSLASSAIVEVVEQEIADIDEMLVMVDGAIGLDYSVDVRLVSTESPPEMRTIAGERIPMRQHHFQKPKEIRKQKRYYEVLLRRDLTH
jgi:hypothetical protein